MGAIRPTQGVSTQMAAWGGGEDTDEYDGNYTPPKYYFSVPVHRFRRRLSFKIYGYGDSPTERVPYYIDAPLRGDRENPYITLLREEGLINLYINGVPPPLGRIFFTEPANIPLSYLEQAGTTFGFVVYYNEDKPYILPMKVEHKRGKFYIWARPKSPEAPLTLVPLRKILGENYTIKKLKTDNKKSKRLNNIGIAILFAIGVPTILTAGGLAAVSILFPPLGKFYFSILAAGLAFYAAGKLARPKLPWVEWNPPKTKQKPLAEEQVVVDDGDAEEKEDEPAGARPAPPPDIYS